VQVQILSPAPLDFELTPVIIRIGN